MTTSNKNFKVKNGLEVLGTSATVDGNDILTTASGIEALANVDTTGVVDGDSIVFNNATSTWIAAAVAGGASFEVSDTAPLDPSPNAVWYNSTSGGLFIYYEDVDSSQWVQVGLQGPVGQGVVAGGTSGQALTKIDSSDFNTQWSDVYSASEVSALLAQLVPSGTISQTARSTAPAGYLICDGSTISRTTYASLFDAIGTTYGAGDGSTTFSIPNLKGKVPVGYDPAQTEFDTLGETGGEKVHTLSKDEMPSHTHIQDAHNHTQNAHSHTGTTSTNGNHSHNIHEEYGATGNSSYPPSNGYYAQIANWNAGTQYLTSWPIDANGNHNHTFTTDSTTATNNSTTATNQSTGGDQAHNNLQPYVVLNYMIKI